LLLSLFVALLACGPTNLDAPEPGVSRDTGSTDTGLGLPPLPDPPPVDQESPDPPEDPPVDPPEPDPVDPPAASCNLGPHSQSFTIQVQHAGATRTALVNLPPGYDGTEVLPMVLNFHGLLMNGTLQRSYTGLADEANARGWIAVHPNGLASSWTVTPFSPDVGFVDALLDALEAEVCVDTTRTYATGLSMGGYFTYMLGCELPERFAAIAPVAGLDANVFCNPAPEVPLLHIHGTADLIVPYNGALFSPSAPDSVRNWSNDVNNCTTAPVVSWQNGDATCATRSCSAASEATLCTIQGGGHTWPGADPIPLLGDSNYDLDATAHILDFFEGYTR
jgi:polyhydroxybutyrate depolymerase